MRQEIFWRIILLPCQWPAWAYRPIFWVFDRCNRGRSFYCFRPESIAKMFDSECEQWDLSGTTPQ